MVTLVKRMITEFYQYGASISDIGDTLKRFLKLIQMLHPVKKMSVYIFEGSFFGNLYCGFLFSRGKRKGAPGTNEF